MNAARPLPSQDVLTAQFYSHLAKGELRLQQCTDCKSYRHLPRYMCPSCHSDQWDWALCSGRGEIYSWTTTMRPLHPAFADAPYTIATVALEEGPRLLARLDGVAPEAVRAGLPVQAEFVTIGPDIGLAQFRSREE